MKINTVNDGIIDVPRVIKYFTHNGRKIAIHRYYISKKHGFDNEFFTATDYLTGCKITFGDTVKEAIELAISAINKNLNFDYSPYEVINK